MSDQHAKLFCMMARLEHITEQIQQLNRVLDTQLATLTPCSEYELLKQLQEYPELAFLQAEPADTHALFQNHFLLFHVLYQLREKYWLSQTAQLEISPLKIQYLPFQAGQQGLTEVDSLRDYYLDLSQLQTTSAHDVDEMMGRFWVGMHRCEYRDDALAILNLADPVDDQTIKKTYKKLVMAHHPDRGGDAFKLQELNMAMDMLLRK